MDALTIHLEQDRLIMYGPPNESAGCVLRGVLSLSLKEPTRIKAINLRFTGKIIIRWTERGRTVDSVVGFQGLISNSDRFFQEERIVVSHDWSFLPKQAKMHTLNAGDHSFDFELPLLGDLPESIQIGEHYLVQYQLKAVAERPALHRNFIARRTLDIIRQSHNWVPEFMDPVLVANQWAGKLDYEITMPSKFACQGDDILVSIRVAPRLENIRIRFVSCSFKEYMTCRAIPPPHTHSRVIKYTRTENVTCERSDNFLTWSANMAVRVPRSPKEVHCDLNNGTVKVRHRLKLVFGVEGPSGKISEVHAVVPVRICTGLSTEDTLPAYEESWRSLPYDPSLMLTLLHNRRPRPAIQRRGSTSSDSSSSSLPHTTTQLPTYEEILLHS